MQQANPLIRTKLRLPLIRPGLVSRPRLQEQITQGLRGPLTMVAAPAGFGKTILVASCVAQCGLPAAWLSLDKNDNVAGRFLNYLVAALQAADPAIGNDAAQMLVGSQRTPAEAVMTSLINDLDAAGADTVLVLDDYQLITEPAVHEVVTFLLEHCPYTLHLVIATRSDPPLPLARLRARGQTVELRASDLRFTVSEAAQFLNEVMGLSLDDRLVAVLEERTEGWVAGLQMAALSMRGRQDMDSFIQAFAGTNRFIMDFMMEEVLARESQDVQAFLLQTSILNRLSGSLCDAVTGGTGGQAMLEALERRNLFVISLDDGDAGGSGPRWYRYHHLFSDLLQASLYHSGQERIAQLFTYAAEWCERDGQVTEAVSYAFAAQNFELAAILIGKHWQQFTNNGEIETVYSWLNSLPENVVKNSAPLSTAFCMVLWLTGQVGAIEAHLLDAERALNELNGSKSSRPVNDAGLAELPMVLAAMSSFVARYHEQFETACTLAERAFSLIPGNLPPLENEQLHSLAFLTLASAYDGVGNLEKAVSAYAECIRRSRLTANATGVAGITFRMIGVLRLLGRLRAADAACRDALGHMQAQGLARLPAAGILHVAMSEVLLEWNDLKGAEDHLAQGMVLGKWSGRLDAVKNTGYVLSRLRQARQDAPGALAAIQELEAALVEPVAPLAKAVLFACRARILLWQGNVSEAARCIENAIQLTGLDQGQTRDVVALAAIRVQLAQCNPDEALEKLNLSLAAAEESGRLGVAIELRILRSLALARQGKMQAAGLDLEHVLALAESEGYVRIFLDEGQPMRMLIAQWLAHASSGRVRNYAIHLLSQFDTEPGETSPVGSLVELKVRSSNDRVTKPEVLNEPLSQRESEVLHLMALGRTNLEIAHQLYVASGTIKAHAASIYRKLDVANRTEAVARARQLGLLP